MINLLKKIIRRLIYMDILGARSVGIFKIGISYDYENKRLYQLVDNFKIFIAKCSHGVPDINGLNMVKWLNEQVYFSNYSPQNNDIYIDIGCGYGHELVYIAKDNPDVKIFGIEANPEVFNYCEANTSNFRNIKNFNLMVGEKESYQIPFSSDYAGKGANDKGLINCEGISLDNFISSNNIDCVSLLKLNIEGGEADIIRNLPFDKIQRLVISCHDFRYDRGDGEFYKTYDEVKKNLLSYGYTLNHVKPSIIPSKEWGLSLKYWIYASK
jgi:FkbM family methyltransferase